MGSTDLDRYLRSLPGEEHAILQALRSTIRKHLPRGYAERFDHGTLAYEIPLTRYPRTYNGRPLSVASIVSRPRFVTLYLMAVYGDAELAHWFRTAYAASGKHLRMGKSCVHFYKAEDIPMDVIGRVIAAVPVARYLEIYERARSGRH